METNIQIRGVKKHSFKKPVNAFYLGMLRNDS